MMVAKVMQMLGNYLVAVALRAVGKASRSGLNLSALYSYADCIGTQGMTRSDSHTTETEQVDSGEHLSNTLADVDSQSVLINTSHMAKKVEETFDDDPELVGVI